MEKDISKITVESDIALYQEEGRWIAHCLMLDVMGDGATKEEAIKVLKDVILTQIEYAIRHKIIDSLIHPAPQKYWNIYKQSDIEDKWRVKIVVSYTIPQKKFIHPRVKLEPCLA